MLATRYPLLATVSASEIVVGGDVEGGGLLVLGDATLEEVLFLLDVHHLSQPRERVFYAGGERGVIVNTSSGAGLQGSVGQSNYSAAKGGIASLTLVQAAELGRYGVTANALAPAARTSMTESAMPDVVKKPEDGGFDAWAPENVAPLVVWLGSSLSRDVTGQIIESQGGRLSLGDGWRTGVTRDKGAQWQPEEVGVAMSQILAEAPKPQRVWGT